MVYEPRQSICGRRHRRSGFAPGPWWSAFLLGAVATASVRAHPLDALSRDEIRRAAAAVHAAGLMTPDSRFHGLALEEPSKSEVLGWSPAMPQRRAARAVIRRPGRTVEAVIDLAAGSVRILGDSPRAQPAYTSTEFDIADRAIRADRRWRNAVRERGSDSASVRCSSMPPAPDDPRLQENRRLLWVVCFDVSRTGGAGYARPLEGLEALVDVDSSAVVEFVDRRSAPTPRPPAPMQPSEPRPAARRPAAGGAGPSRAVRLNGSMVHWRRWSFHLRMDERNGPVVSLARYRDDGRERLVLYQGALAEIYVPYMDPDPSWLRRAPLDAAQFGLGRIASVLEPGRDCPASAVYLDATFADDGGRPQRRQRTTCLFERAVEAPVIRHRDNLTGLLASVPASELVVRTIATAANYDYVLDWVFGGAGEIEYRVGATGMVLAKAIASEPPQPRASAPSGVIVASDLLAVNHDHLLSFRLDLDVDGQNNSFVVKTSTTLAQDESGRTIWTTTERTARTEHEAVELAGALGEGHARWLVVNPQTQAGRGVPAAYEIEPLHGGVHAAHGGERSGRLDRPPFRAGLWARPYDADDQPGSRSFWYAGEADAGSGWQAANRPILGRDIVLWCTLLMRHVPRTEDWPVMPTAWQGVRLRPVNFFGGNPILRSGPVP